MKRLFIILSLTIASVLNSPAQQPDSAHFRIGMQSALGYGCFRESGASPLTYRGIEIVPAIFFEAEWGSWRTDGHLQFNAGAYIDDADGLGIKAFGLVPQARWQLWRHCVTLGAWNLYGGLGVAEMFDFRMFPQLENSNVGITNALCLSLHARAERNIGHWLMHGSIGFTPAAWMYRPGFAFISNYDRTPDSPLASTFDQYHAYLTGACGLESELGFTLLLANGNRIGFCYRWHHLTSRSCDVAPYRFDQASHTLCTNLIFQLR